MRAVRRRGLSGFFIAAGTFLVVAGIPILVAQSISRWRYGYWMPFWMELRGSGHTTVVIRVCALPESLVARRVQITDHATRDVWSSEFVRDGCADVSVRIPTASRTSIFGSAWRGAVLDLEVTVVSAEGETIQHADSLRALLGRRWLSPDECINPVVINLSEKKQVADLAEFVE